MNATYYRAVGHRIIEELEDAEKEATDHSDLRNRIATIRINADIALDPTARPDVRARIIAQDRW